MVFEGGMFLRFWKFPENLDIWKNSQAFGKFPKYEGI